MTILKIRSMVWRDASPSGAEVFRQNDPGDVSSIAEHAFATLPALLADVPTTGVIDGCVWRGSADANMSIITDTSAPFSGDNEVFQLKFPNGLAGGQEPTRYHLWNECSETGGTQYDKVYFNTIFKLKGPPGNEGTWETEQGPLASLTKFWGFIGVGRGASFPPTNSYGCFDPNGTMATEVDVAWVNQDVQTRRLNHNMNASWRLQIDQWYESEILVEINNPVGTANGKLDWWMRKAGTGFEAIPTKILEYTNVQYRDSSNSAKFFGRRHDPTWSSNSTNKTRDDFILIDHEYIASI